jgi:hypothetical protein
VAEIAADAFDEIDASKPPSRESATIKSRDMFEARAIPPTTKAAEHPDGGGASELPHPGRPNPKSEARIPKQIPNSN